MCVMSAMIQRPFDEHWPLKEYTYPDWRDYKKLIDAAKVLDKVNGEPDCSTDDKKELLKQMQKMIDAAFEKYEKTRKANKKAKKEKKIKLLQE